MTFTHKIVMVDRKSMNQHIYKKTNQNQMTMKIWTEKACVVAAD